MTSYVTDADGLPMVLFFTKESPFSNFHVCKFYDSETGLHFSCSEQRYMFKKAVFFDDGNAAEQIMKTNQPREIKAIGTRIRGFCQTKWEEESKKVMRDTLTLKFSQNRDLLATLLSTGDSTLVEASPYDTRWGIGISRDNEMALDRRNWRGENRLGNILMGVRSALRDSAFHSPPFQKRDSPSRVSSLLSSSSSSNVDLLKGAMEKKICVEKPDVSPLPSLLISQSNPLLRAGPFQMNNHEFPPLSSLSPVEAPRVVKYEVHYSDTVSPPFISPLPSIPLRVLTNVNKIQTGLNTVVCPPLSAELSLQSVSVDTVKKSSNLCSKANSPNLKRRFPSFKSPPTSPHSLVKKAKHPKNPVSTPPSSPHSLVKKAKHPKNPVSTPPSSPYSPEKKVKPPEKRGKITEERNKKRIERLMESESYTYGWLLYFESLAKSNNKNLTSLISNESIDRFQAPLDRRKVMKKTKEIKDGEKAASRKGSDLNEYYCRSISINDFVSASNPCNISSDSVTHQTVNSNAIQTRQIPSPPQIIQHIPRRNFSLLTSHSLPPSRASTPSSAHTNTLSMESSSSQNITLLSRSQSISAISHAKKLRDRSKFSLQRVKVSRDLLRSENMQLSQTIRSKDSEISKLNTKLDAATKGWENTKLKLAGTKGQITSVKTEIRKYSKRVRLREEDIVMKENMQDKSGKIITKVGGRYTLSATKTAFSLKNMGISDEKIGPAMQTVLENMSGQTMSNVPSASTIGRKGYAQLALARAHSRSVLAEGVNNQKRTQRGLTICSDETTKRERKLQAYIVCVPDKDGNTRNQLLDIREVASKDALTSLNTLLSILDDIDRVDNASSVHGSVSPQFRNLVIGAINVAMGDRASTQKKFAELVQEYRRNILPTILIGWKTMNPQEKRAHLTFLSIPCFVHIVASMAEPICEDFAKHEFELLNTIAAGEGRASSITLIRNMMKNFGPRSAAITGTYRDYKAWCKCNNVKTVRLPTLKGKRFNVIPKSATIITTHRDHFLFFISKYRIDRVDTLKQGLDSELIQAQVLVLALVDCYLTSPIWTLAKDQKMHVLDTALFVGELLKWVDARERDPTLLFNGTPPNITAATSNDIFELNEYDNSYVMKQPSTPLALVVAKRVMRIVAIFLRRVFSPFLPGGEYHSMCTQIGTQANKLRNAFEAAPCNNVPVEGAFGLADYISNRAPRMRTERIAAETMMRMNHTMEWVNSLSENDQEKLLTECIALGPTLEKEGKAAKNAILEKLCDKMYTEANIEQEKVAHIQTDAEKCIDDLFSYGGFFSSTEDLDQFIRKTTDEQRITDAMQTQLKVRSNKLLNQTTVGAKNFTLSENSIPLMNHALIKKVRRAIQNDPIIPVNTFCGQNVMEMCRDYDHVFNGRPYPFTILSFRKASKKGTPYALVQFQMGTKKKLIWTEELFTKDMKAGTICKRKILMPVGKVIGHTAQDPVGARENGEREGNITYALDHHLFMKDHDYCGGDGI